MLWLVALAFTGTRKYDLNLFIKEVKGGVVHYNYLCTYGKSERCECPQGKECTVLLTYKDTTSYEPMEVIICGPNLDDPLDPLPSSVHFPDTSPQINVIISDDCPINSYDGGGDSGSDPPPPPTSPPLCLDTKVYEEQVGPYTIGLYFKEPSGASPSLPVVLLIHGMGSDCRRWEGYLATWFAQDGYRVAAVNLFPHNVEAPSEVQGWMFHPNGTHLNELIDILHGYITRNYPGWNNKIIVVAHSRAGLEMEDVLYIRHNTHVDGVITLGTPFYGSSLADFGVGFCDRSPWESCAPLLFKGVYIECVAAVELAHRTICQDFPPDMYILTTPAVTNWRRNAHVDVWIDDKPVKFHVGVGWTPEWKCGPFGGLNQAGCVITRYLLLSGCNDGAVTFSGNYDRWNNFRDYTRIFSRAPSDFRHICSGDPQEWEKDHTQVVESRDVYSEVEEEVRYIDSSTTFLFPEGPVPFSPPKAPPEDHPVEVFSRSYLTLVGAGYLFVHMETGEDSILIWSKNPLVFDYVFVADTQRMGGGKLYEVHTHTPTFSFKVNRIRGETDELEDYNPDDFDPVAIFFADGDPLYVRLNKNTYLEGEPIMLKIVYPHKDTLSAAFLNTLTGRVYPVSGFYERGDTSIAAITLPEEGVYKLFVYASKMGSNGEPISPRTAVATVLVVGSVDMDRVMGVLTGRYPAKGEGGAHLRSGRGPVHSNVRGDYLRVHLDEGTYTVYDISGYRVKTGRVEEGLVPLSDLRRGVFFVVVGGKTYKVIR